jgi:hypothetical protein
MYRDGADPVPPTRVSEQARLASLTAIETALAAGRSAAARSYSGDNRTYGIHYGFRLIDRHHMTGFCRNHLAPTL